MEPEKRKNSAPPTVTTIPISHQNGKKPRNPEQMVRDHLPSRGKGQWFTDRNQPGFNDEITKKTEKTDNLIERLEKLKAKNNPTARSISLGGNPINSSTGALSSKPTNGFFNSKENSPTIVESPPTPTQQKNPEELGIFSNQSGKQPNLSHAYLCLRYVAF